MIRYLITRFTVFVCVLLTVSVVSFALLRATGDPAVAMAGEGATADDVALVRHQYGLDRSLPAQYLSWASKAVRGDLGTSKFLQQPVFTIVVSRLPATMKLGGVALLLAVVIAIPLGVLAALYRNTVVDQAALTLALVGQAIPTFWFALILMVVFSAKLRIFPISGDATWKHFVLPAAALSFYAIPSLMRLTRSGMLDTLSSDYVRTARAKGLRPAVILFKHALRNAILPVISLSAVQLGFMLGGSVVIENIFAINGLGNLSWQSIKRADFEVMQAIVLILGFLFVFLTFLADLINTFLDPRVRH